MEINPRNHAATAVPRPVGQVSRSAPRAQPPAPFDPIALTRRLSTILDGQLADKPCPQAKSAVGQVRRASIARRASMASTEPLKIRIGVNDGNGPLMPQTNATYDRRTSTGSLSKWQFDRRSSTVPQQPVDRRLSTGCFDHDWRGTRSTAYVPQYAAAQFARTTTVETLAEKAIVIQVGPAAPTEPNRTPRRSYCGRERLSSTLQHLTIPESPHEVEEQKTWQPRHSFETLFWAKSLGQGQGQGQENDVDPLNLSNVDRSDLNRSSVNAPPDGNSSRGPSRRGSAATERRQSIMSYCSAINDHRVDWTQSDEPELAASKWHRRRDSLARTWARFGGFSKPGKDHKPTALKLEKDDARTRAGITDLPTPPISPFSLTTKPLSPPLSSPASNVSVSPRTGFLSRFKN